MFVLLIYLVQLLAVISAYSETLRVPIEYTTIQSAFNAVQAHDTVLVDTGTYAEALYAPPLSFVLKGNTITDTGDYPRPVINPASLSGSDSLACLIVPVECAITIEDFKFANGPQMFPRIDQTRWGGIIIYGELPDTIRRCVFDSVFAGIFFGQLNIQQDITLENCKFFDCLSNCVNVRGALKATDCFFSGVHTTGLVGCKDFSVIERCHFWGDVNWSYGGFNGSDCTISSCVFGPGSVGFNGPIGCNSWGENHIEDNLFADLTLNGTMMRINYRDGDPVYIQRNHFTRLSLDQGQWMGILISVDGPGDTANQTAVIKENIFDNYTGSIHDAILPKAIQTDGKVTIYRNHFINIEPAEATVISTGWRQVDPGYITDNIFINNGLAIKSHFMDVDATHNYWGNPTGPRHSTNPFGLGDSVSDHVNFNPWYADTAFFNLSSEKPIIPLPSCFSLSVYPNPFNSTAKIKLQVKEPMIVKVELFDLLGRRVKELSNTPIDREKEISFQADNLASGVYFVRATETLWNRPLATQKLLLMK